MQIECGKYKSHRYFMTCGAPRSDRDDSSTCCDWGCSRMWKITEPQRNGANPPRNGTKPPETGPNPPETGPKPQKWDQTPEKWDQTPQKRDQIPQKWDQTVFFRPLWTLGQLLMFLFLPLTDRGRGR